MDRRIYAMEYHDLNRIEKLNQLECVETFWDDVRKLCKNIRSDHSIKRWQILAENRFEELLNGIGFKVTHDGIGWLISLENH